MFQPKKRTGILLGIAVLFLGVAWVALRAQSNAALTEELDVVYGETSGKKLLLDVFRQANAPTNGTLPAVVFIHGGGWSGGNKKDFHALAKGLARQGYVTASVSYRLLNGSTNNTYPAQLDDVQRAIRWFRANAGKYGINPDKIGAIGASAGGHLVALLGVVDTRDNSDKALAAYSSKVQCVVDIFGPTDLTPDFTTYGESGPAIQKLVDNLVAKPKSTNLDAYKAASPLFSVSSNSAPFLMFHGTVDPLVPLDQSEKLDAALKKAGVESKLIVFQGEGHGFAKKENVETFYKESVAFFARHLKK
ncbi:MAG TPA: alpha/beta hydrolase [Roseimicrobium sp.]|nr:alpha/beta hydrolase [Roseimicrobium sp.]